jgi:PAS domain S-box-containing protein
VALRRLAPNSLVTRVYALYSATLLIFVGLGLGLFYRYQFTQQVEDAQISAAMMVEVAAQTVAESAVIGDYDTIKRTLEKLVAPSQFASAAFIDLKGGAIRVERTQAQATAPPAWLHGRIADRLFDINQNISVGGRDYGVMRLKFDVDVIAESLWQLLKAAALLACASLAGGLLLIWFALKRWLGTLDRVRTFERDFQLGIGNADVALMRDLPSEFRNAFEVLIRTSTSLRKELESRDKALTSLRRVIEDLVPATHPARQPGNDSIEAMSAMVAELVRERETSRRALDNQKFALDQHAIVSLTDRDGAITYANDRFCSISGYCREELLGRNHRILKSGAHPAEFYATLWQTIAAGQVWHGEICNRAKDGRLYWVSATIVPLVGSDGRPEQYIAIRTDISARKAAETALSQAKEEAEAANRAKSEFLANMSHEIRTPMNGILGMTDLVLETDLDAEQRDYVSIVKSSAEALLTIINDILDFSKIEAGKLLIETIPYDLSKVVNETLRSLALRTGEKQIELLCEIAPELAGDVLGDPGRLRQILTNLVGNAIKFTEQGEVSVSFGLAEQDGDRLLVDCAVRDTGIGIAPDKLEHIFEAFTQGDTSTSRKYGGTGLGLSISQRLVELMGGRMWVESQLGCGSTFHFSLALRKVAAVGAAIARDRQVAGKHVLVVDDNQVNRKILGRILDHWGVRWQEAASGPEAIDRLMAAEPRFDCILLDGHMPEMDGFQLANVLQQPVYARRRPPIIMMSSGASGEEAERSRALGVALYLGKPVASDELLAALVNVLRGAGEDLVAAASPVGEAASHEGQAGDAPHLLVVEDNLVNQKLATTLLERRGYRVSLAINGAEAVRAVTEGQYDLLLMDMQMPVMGGLEATREIRALEARLGRKPVPIIAMTANAMRGDRDACLAAGMDDYLAKPIKAAEVYATVARHLPD